MNYLAARIKKAVRISLLGKCICHIVGALMDAKVQFVILAQWPGDRKVLRSKCTQFSPSSLLLVACPFQSLSNWPSLETA